MPEPPGAKLKASVLLVLCIAGTAALVKALVGVTPVPDGQWLVLDQGRLPGYHLQPRPSQPPASGFDRSHGMVQRWKVTPLAGGSSLQLVVVQLRSRGHQGFSLEQLTRGPAAPTALTIDQPRLVAIDARGDELLVGKLNNPSQGPQSDATQTCLVREPSGRVGAGASQQRLMALVKGSEKPLSPAWKLAQLAGAIPHLHWQCTLVSVASPAQAGHAWQRDNAKQRSAALRTVIESRQRADLE